MAGCKSKTRFIPATVAWIVLIVATSLFFIYPCQHLQEKYHISITIIQGIITFFVISNFFLATFMDPGVIPKASRDEDKGDDFRSPLFESVEINGINVRMKWCQTCQFYRPPRCSHCSVCNTCIETFDHHCPWVNNCIGRRNYRHFFFFLIFLSIHMITVFIWCVLFVLDRRDSLQDADTIVAFVILGLIALLFIPVIGLTGFHIVLVSRGRTTNEQVTGKFQGGYNPFSRGCPRNCIYTLCGPQYPRHKPRKVPSVHYLPYSSLISGVSNRGENIVRVYMDENKAVLLNSPSSSRRKHSFDRITVAARPDSIPLDRFDMQMESQSQDCDPEPPKLQGLRRKVMSPTMMSSEFNSQQNINTPSAAGQVHASAQPNVHSSIQQGHNTTHNYSGSSGTNSSSSQRAQQYITSPTSGGSNFKNQPTSPKSSVQSPSSAYSITTRRVENGKTETTFSATSHDQTNNSQGRQNVYLAKSPTSVEIGTQTTHHYSYPRTTVTNATSTTTSSTSSSMTTGGNHNTSGGVIIYYSPEGSSNNGPSSANIDSAKEPLNPSATSHQIARRPMSFMKALEMSSETPFDRQARLTSIADRPNALPAAPTSSAAQSLLESASSVTSPSATNPSSPSSSHPLHHSLQTHSHHGREKSRERDRDRNQFEMNYEISV